MKIIKITAACLLITWICYSHYPFSYVCTDQVIGQIMGYPMPDVIKRCQKDYGYTDEDMIILEKEFKRYLILAVLAKNNSDGVGMYSKDVDNLWHSFILFTKDYSDFCSKYSGKFIHHLPETSETKTSEQMAETQKDFYKFIKKYEETFAEEIHSVWLLDIFEDQVA